MTLSLNNTNNTVLKDGTEKQLTSKEFGILSFLMDHQMKSILQKKYMKMFGKKNRSAVVQLYVFIFAIFAKNWKVLTPKKS